MGTEKEKIILPLVFTVLGSQEYKRALETRKASLFIYSQVKNSMAMQVIKLSSGLLAYRLTREEQDNLWLELSQDISPIGKDIELFTPQDNKGYYIISETELKYDHYESVIRANGKTIRVKYNICNQQAKTYKAVRKAYEI